MARQYTLQRPAAAGPRIDFAAELNAQQCAAVTAPPGPALVIAGAGSGKTRTLTYRVAYLVENGVPPSNILLLTFTNKASREMLDRVANLLPNDISGLWGGTFHSVGNRLLRRNPEAAGFAPGFSIMDREDQQDLLDAVIAKLGHDPKDKRFPKGEVLADVFSYAINTGRSIEDVLVEKHPHFLEMSEQIAEAQKKYEAKKKTANSLDFDDLLEKTLLMLQHNPELAAHYQRQFQFVLVDEYQDTNRIQADFIDILAKHHGNVMVVGDDAQSIYSWRGANFKNILEFPKRYPTAKTYKIETNYRSVPDILEVANAAISANVNQFRKELVAVRDAAPVKPALVPLADSAQQALFIAQRVLELREEGVPMDKMAVLYRSHFHALELQLELTRRNIPFSITSGIRFFEQAHIKDVAAYLKLVSNPTDELAFKRLVQMLPGVGGKGAEKLWSNWNAERGTRSAEQGTLAAALQKCSAAVPKKAATAWAEFVITISQLEAPAIRAQPAKMIRQVIEAGYEDYLQETFPNYRSRLDDLEQLASFALQFTSTEDFLTQLSLLTNLEAEAEQAASKDTEQLRLSTIHQAKGLEFDVVFIIMLCDGMFPSARSMESTDGEEEERRLFYVAITRARNELYLSWPLIRATAGYGGDLMQQRSRFLTEIPAELLDEWNLRPFNPYG